MGCIGTNEFVPLQNFEARRRAFVTGHDLVVPIRAGKMSRASAPADLSFAGFAFRSDFFRSQFNRAAEVA
jgi:hypothetical protein